VEIIPNSDCKHALKMLRKIMAELFVQVGDNFSICMRTLEVVTLLLKSLAQASRVKDFTIENRHDPTIL
jgi:hypothetical protein